MDLKQIRAEIDQIDRQLVDLLEQRMNRITEVVQYKKEKQLPILDQGREKQVLAKVECLVKDRQYTRTIQKQFQDIMKRSKEYQSEVSENVEFKN